MTSINISFFFFLNWSLRLISEHSISNSNFLSPSSLHLLNRMCSVIQLTQFLRAGNMLYSFLSTLQVIDAQKWFGSERINIKAVFPQLTGQLTYRWVLRHRPNWMTMMSTWGSVFNYVILPYIHSFLAGGPDASGSISSFRLETLPWRLPLLWVSGSSPILSVPGAWQPLPWTYR